MSNCVEDKIKKTVLIFGGLGFIGKNLALNICNGYDKVIIFDDLSNSTLINDKINQKLKNTPNVEIILDSVLNYDNVANIVKQSNIIYYMACKQISTSFEDPLSHIRINYEAWINILDVIVKNNLKMDKLIYTSSTCIYGDKKNPLTEETEPQILNIYAATKYASEQTSMMYGKLFNLPIVILRYSNVYGPGQTLNNGYCGVIGKFLSQIKQNNPVTIIGNGNQTRDFTYIDNVVKLSCLVINNISTNLNVYNISEFNKTSVNQIVDIIKKYVKQDFEIVNIEKRNIDDVQDREVDNRKILSTLNVTINNNSLDHGINETYKYLFDP